MYKLFIKKKKVKNKLYKFINLRRDIKEKIEILKENPRKELNAHKLNGKLDGLWGCYLGYDIRIVYRIDEDKKEIIIFDIGSHKIYT